VQPVGSRTKRPHSKVRLSVIINVRALESFNDSGLSHDLVRMKYL